MLISPKWKEIRTKLEGNVFDCSFGHIEGPLWKLILSELEIPLKDQICEVTCTEIFGLLNN